jgi:hypothetical protein
MEDRLVASCFAAAGREVPVTADPPIAVASERVGPRHRPN